MTARASLAFVALLAIGLVSAAPALAQAKTGSPTTVNLDQPSKGSHKGHLTLRATLRGPDGKPVSSVPIRFYQQTSVFGQRDALVGSAVTDSSGEAAIDFQPARAEKVVLKARFAGNNDLAASEGSTTFQVQDVVPIYEEPPLPLASVRQWLPVGLGTLVLCTWAVLLGVFARTVIGLRAAERQPATSRRVAAPVPATTTDR